MNKTWIIFNRRNQDRGRRDGWNYFKEISISRQQAEHEMKRQVEKDAAGREWALFELVSAFTTKVEAVPAAIVDPIGDIPEIVDMPVNGINPPHPAPFAWPEAHADDVDEDEDDF